MRPHWRIILKIVGKVTAEMMTSLPWGNSNALRARSPAQLPLVVSIPYFTPRNLATSSSIFLASEPVCQFPVFILLIIDFSIALSSSLPVMYVPPYLKSCFITILYVQVSNQSTSSNSLQNLRVVANPCSLAFLLKVHIYGHVLDEFCENPRTHISTLSP